MARKKIEVTREIMRNRIHVAEVLRSNYLEMLATISTPGLPENVVKVLRAALDSSYESMNKAERRVIVSVQKKLGSDFRIACDSFNANTEMWISDPSVTIVENSDDDEDSEISQDSLTEV